MKETRKGMLLVLSGPSGAGKGTLGSFLMEDKLGFQFSVSATTRACRPGEIPGKSYHFLSDEEFDRLEAEDAFLEHATVHGNRYGTLKSEVEQRLLDGHSVLLDIDQQGAIEVMKKIPDCVSVFILPPSYEELLRRLLRRNTEHRDEIERRMRNAPGEIAKQQLYDYVIVNDDPKKAYKRLKKIVKAEMQRATRYCPELEDSAESALESYDTLRKEALDAIDKKGEVTHVHS